MGRSTWRMPVLPAKGDPRVATLPAGELWKAYVAAQRGELRAVLICDGSPHYGLVPLDDLTFLERGSGTPTQRPTTAVPLLRRASPKTAPEEAAASETLRKAGLLALQGSVRVALTQADRPIAAVVLLDELKQLETAAAAASAV